MAKKEKAVKDAAAPEAAPKAPKAPKIEANGITRPAEGTSTARIWTIADEKSAAAGAPAKRKDVLDQAVAEGLNAATAATQYGRWCKFHGVKQVKEEKPVAPETAPEGAAPAA